MNYFPLHFLKLYFEKAHVFRTLFFFFFFTFEIILGWSTIFIKNFSYLKKEKKDQVDTNLALILRHIQKPSQNWSGR